MFGSLGTVVIYLDNVVRIFVTIVMYKSEKDNKIVMNNLALIL